MIVLKNVFKEYKTKKNNKVQALNDISLILPLSGMVFICGKSGSGKSTLLNLIGSLDTPSSGEILFNNKSLVKLKKKELDLYRNKYVGFIFQDFNLFEDLTVFQNINLVSSLQGKNINKNDIQDYLKKVNLCDFEDRKINELSAGQKQRIAILRSISKDSKIILCDEPTGNLDEENSIQIFNLLKELSKEKLIIVVSHDSKSAYKYADRIINLDEGKIISDEQINIIQNDNDEFKLEKTKLSFKNSLFLALNNLKNKKIRLIITSIIITVILSSIGISFMLTNFDVNKTHAETMVREGESRINIRKQVIGENLTIDNPILTFTSEEINEVNNKLNNNTINVKKIVENNRYLNFEFGDIPFDIDIEYDNTLYAFYALSSNCVKFLNINSVDNLKVIGKKEINENEIIIKKVLADHIIKNGIKIYELNDNDKRIKTDYFPKDYNDLITSNKDIVFGSVSLKIVGIIDDDISKYDELKSIPASKAQKENNKLYNEFISKYRYNMSDVIVNPNIYNHLKLSNNNVLDLSFYKYSYVYKNNEFFTYDGIEILNKNISVFNGNKNIDINKLNDNEIILSSSMVDVLTNNEFTKSFSKYYDEEFKKYNSRVKERDEKIITEENKLLDDPNYVINIIPEIEPLNYEEMYHDYLIKFIKEKEFIGSEIILDISDNYLRTQSQKSNTYKLKIVGYSIDSNNSYVSNNVLESYMRENYEISDVYFDETDVIKLETIFNSFPLKKSKYISETMFSNTIITLEVTVNYIKKIASYISIGLLIFALIVIINFIATSINNNKKHIGILKSLGTHDKDIFKIFYLESFIVGLISYIFASVITFFGCNILNNIISSDLFYKTMPIIFNVKVLIFMLFFVFIIVTLASLIVIKKIVNKKTIDVIYVK